MLLFPRPGRQRAGLSPGVLENDQNVCRHKHNMCMYIYIYVKSCRFQVVYIYTHYIYIHIIYTYYIYILYIHIYIYIDIGDTNANIERMCNDMNYIYLGSGEIRAPWDMKPWHSCSCHNTIATQRSLKRWKVHWHVSLPQQPWHNPRIPGLLVTPNFLNFGQSTPD